MVLIEPGNKISDGMASHRHQKKHEIGGHNGYDGQVSHEHRKRPQGSATQRRQPPIILWADRVFWAEFSCECEQKHQQERETVVV